LLSYFKCINLELHKIRSDAVIACLIASELSRFCVFKLDEADRDIVHCHYCEVLKESVESFLEIYKHPFQCIL